VVFGDDLTLVYANGNVQAILGYDPAEVVGRSLAEFVHPTISKRAVAGVQARAAGERRAGTTSVRLRCADGISMACDISAARVHDGERTLVAVYGRSASIATLSR